MRYIIGSKLILWMNMRSRQPILKIWIVILSIIMSIMALRWITKLSSHIIISWIPIHRIMIIWMREMMIHHNWIVFSLLIIKLMIFNLLWFLNSHHFVFSHFFIKNPLMMHYFMIDILMSIQAPIILINESVLLNIFGRKNSLKTVQLIFFICMFGCFWDGMNEAWGWFSILVDGFFY